MTTTRPNKLPTNLKERIAALEQRNTVNSPGSPNSPGTSPGLTDANGAQSGKLKDRIAKFERKGGVPVPRGSFGLGAPPTGEGLKRQGELYGNRIQAPGKLTPQYTGGSIGSFAHSPPRRSFSTSILNGDFDDNCPPIPSPSSIGTPGSPEFNSFSPEASPSLSTNGDLPAIKRHATGTSFHTALEFARKVEAAKREASKPPTKKKSTDSANTERSIESSTTIPMKPLNETVDPTPAIFESSGGRASTVSEELPSQSSGMADSLVGPSADCQPPVVALEESLLDRPRKRNLSLAKSTIIVSDNQTPSKVEPVKGLSAPSNIENSTGPTQIPTLSSPALSEPPQFSFSQPPSLELHPSGKRERGGSESSLRKGLTPNKTPQILPDDAPVLAGSFEVTGDRKDLPLVSEAAPKDVGTSASKNAIEASTPATKTMDELPPRTRSQIPARRARPTIQPPDPPSFSSPPSGGFHSATASSAASLSSANSLPSITEMSPSEVSRALKMTPSTGRGIPVFLPPSNSHTTRKSDFVYLPSSPEDRPNFGVGLDGEDSSIVNPGHPKTASEPGPTKTVVHGKVKETPASATLPTKRQVIPRTPMKSTKRASILQNTLSPGHGELAALLQEAMLLEDTLNKGELPGESPIEEPEDEFARAEADPNSKYLDAAKLKEEEEERQRAAEAISRSKRDIPTHGRLKHTFLMPLSRARASQKQETLPPAEQPTPRSSRDESRPKSSIFDHAGDREVVQEKSQSPSKIPKLPSFKKFGSISRKVTQQDALLRYSYSTSSEISSEDSNFIVTPPDNAAMEFGERKSTKDTDQQSAHSTLSFSFPSLSPKRAASFAEKMWSRARTSSNGSILSSASGVTPRSTEESTPQLQLPHIPSLSSIVPPVSEKDSALHRPVSGSSLKNRIDTSGISKAPSVPASSTTHAQPKTPEDVLLVPDVGSPNQPLSAVSMSSFGSLPSPLFDKAICDAFPSVPTGTPAQLRNSYLFRGRGQSLNPATGAPADFDSALLSSAIHLAARNKATSSSDYTVPTSAQ